ncbi:MAG: tRNA preQ1(34) S-adenosylmethionine ribosyltransferase-isomerase QueA [Candidatus Magasanikbacteria bacterium CG10_big_fil_rev_8_21_14_0_10_36_32]|uniref:S-adenosylmethionine:tRNA ribosyltransferase-isomerase n=1 Tax=Candidatus Magasanikbacteria bacterium CG10_big_fil_rev_8_21_14_0_10_36_32 TaxID=1974646 RepID=A0A2M6W6E6_9BACT|nr:MAG: tRNA preQ1(34) S-adenosylmethionine ribosyltransferase-isomerase QueA [Candidatus Magasanikbacteria bacterium CG10_big_fil_rev_8_21_14_0_10_36_32]
MLTSEFDYNLPDELIAQMPVEPRDSSRLMVIDKNKKTVDHRYFYDVSDYFKKGDLLVWNVSKVFNARLNGMVGEKSVEIFLLRPAEQKIWTVLAKPAKKLSVGMKIKFAGDFECEVLKKNEDGTLLVNFNENEVYVRIKANKYGQVPTPPYIKLQVTSHNGQLSEQYQTVYAKNEGSVAAPTAGLHFTPELIKKIKAKGVNFAEVTLHVGLGTFQPVKTEKIEEHKMHSEWVELSDEAVNLINQAKAEGRRVVAVGTTTTRTLEGIYQKYFPTQGRDSDFTSEPIPTIKPYSGDINIFITPGFQFKIVDALITNFHLPKSTLLMLVSAFAGDKDFILDCYNTAVEKKYRFFSFGDAMIIF